MLNFLNFKQQKPVPKNRNSPGTNFDHYRRFGPARSG